MSLNWTCKVALYKFPPHSFLDEREDGSVRIAGGRYSQVFEAVMESLNQSCEYRLHESLGGRHKNGTWFGAMGSMYNNETNIFFGPVSINLKYFSARIINTSPILKFRLAMYTAAKTDSTYTNSMGLLATFPLQVWACLISAIILASWVLKLIEPKRLRIPSFMYTLPWICMTGVSSLRLDQAAAKLSGRILCATFLFFSILTANYFSTDLIASLTFKPGAPKVKDFKDFVLNFDHVKFNIFKDTSAQFMIQDSNDSLMKKLWTRITRDNSAVPITSLYTTKFLKTVSEGKESYLADNGSAEFQAAKFCATADSSKLGEFYSPFYMIEGMAGSYVHQNESPDVKASLNFKLQAAFDMGLMEHTFPDEQFRPTYDRCKMKKSASDTIRPLGVNEVAAVFYVYFTGSLMASVVCIIETVRLQNIAAFSHAPSGVVHYT